jgi:hypothetical protein
MRKGPVPAAEEVVVAVLNDVHLGFDRLLSDVEVDLVEPFNDPPYAISDGEYTVVAWTLTGRNSRDIFNVEPSNRTVNVEGVTIVRHADEEPHGWTYYRFIDWNAIAGQIGTSRGRVTTPSPTGPILLKVGDQPRGGSR